MSRILLAGAAAIGVAGLVAMTPASANEQRADGARNAQLDQWEFSDRRRRYRNRRYYSRRYYGGPRYYSGYYAPYYAYAPRPYYRPYGYGYYPYQRPGLSFSFGF